MVFAAGGFYAGMQYQKGKAGNFARGQFQNGLRQQSGFQTRDGLQAIRPVSGEIMEKGESTITLKTQDGGNRIVIYSDSTRVNKSSEGSSADLKVGEEVIVIGTEGADGTVTAQTISIGDRNSPGMPDEK